ncbi:MAG: hypothetical protein AB1486_08265 [Planctomycetota bacterium]
MSAEDYFEAGGFVVPKVFCFNDACPFLQHGWLAMNQQGNYGFATRVMYIRERNSFSSVPVRSLQDLRDGIVEE